VAFVLFIYFWRETVDVIVKKKVVALKCSLEEPCRHHACIASIANLHAKLVEGRANASSNCSEDTNSTSLQEDVQGSSYVQSWDGDENT
jgi:hypothetical protein